MMDLREAAARMLELFPGKYTTVEAKITNNGGPERDKFRVYAERGAEGDGWMVWGVNLDAMLILARMEAERRAMALSAAAAPEQDPSAAAECLTQALTAAAGGEYTAAEHARAGARLAGDVAASEPEGEPEPGTRAAADFDRAARIEADVETRGL